MFASSLIDPVVPPVWITVNSLSSMSPDDVSTQSTLPPLPVSPPTSSQIVQSDPTLPLPSTPTTPLTPTQPLTSPSSSGHEMAAVRPEGSAPSEKPADTAEQLVGAAARDAAITAAGKDDASKLSRKQLAAQKQAEQRKQEREKRKADNTPLLCRHTCCVRAIGEGPFWTFSDSTPYVHEQNETHHPKERCGDEEKRCPMYDTSYGIEKMRKETKQAISASKKRAGDTGKDEQAVSRTSTQCHPK